MSIISDLRTASKAGRLPNLFTAKDCQKLNLPWNSGAYATYLPKHCLGNPGNYTAYFLRVKEGLYELLPEAGGNRANTRKYKYQALKDYLIVTPTQIQTITLSFQQVEIIIRANLPPAARRFRAWWANQQVGSRPQAESWMNAGFKVDKVNFTGTCVTFKRI
ncbi:MAG: hypothetical protein BWX54_00908 [Verrucomicrobia bacterium ADurb.Bin018]|jgi:hypothetical protein|nr:MAG: hypothetical protein BWX54_00908 [Verrucomicrobia bacterium ADurb.Bin018]